MKSLLLENANWFEIIHSEYFLDHSIVCLRSAVQLFGIVFHTKAADFIMDSMMLNSYSVNVSNLTILILINDLFAFFR